MDVNQALYCLTNLPLLNLEDPPRFARKDDEVQSFICYFYIMGLLKS